jgi:hypothetical protein
MDELNKKEFLTKLADLMDAYQASIMYTRDDDGAHIELTGKEIFVGWLIDTRDLREAAVFYSGRAQKRMV